MRGLLVGSVIGLAFGYHIGRRGERLRRSYRDYGVARSTVPKTRQAARSEARGLSVAGLVVGALLIALLVGAVDMPAP